MVLLVWSLVWWESRRLLKWPLKVSYTATGKRSTNTIDAKNNMYHGRNALTHSYCFVWMWICVYIYQRLLFLVKRRWICAWLSCPFSLAAIAAAASPGPIPAKAIAWSFLVPDRRRRRLVNRPGYSWTHSVGRDDSKWILAAICSQYFSE